ncbi:hypothetical protein GSI_09610 [Ganoderma sinense ZZ0214-1]|uniref:Uncharacterized protein n=1 Tax=Ganoderma sinense ZZ0214-1 TaxID=1077348 RepID=A0A2G8S3I1_9APHY|nr:hypothetical protein GSI_09610 [Ganoderma sinense ZZ0214-1]
MAPPSSPSENADFWWVLVPDVLDRAGKPRYRCTVCNDHKTHEKKYKTTHERTVTHQGMLEAHRFRIEHPGEDDSALHAAHEAQRALIDDAALQLLRSLLGGASMDSEGVSGDSPASAPAPGPGPARIDWGLLEAGTEAAVDYPLDREVIHTVAQDLYRMYSEEDNQDDGDLSEDDGTLEREDGDVEEGPPVPEPTVYVNDGVELPTAPRKRTMPEDDARRRRHWFPWHDKISCTLDVLMHLPRSVFSQRQLDLFLWLLRVNGVEDVPSVRSMLGLNAALQRACGVDTIPYKGALGHNYHVNALDQILAQEMANPRVRPYLHFYPEDTGGRYLAEARQGRRWLEEVADDVLTPMLRLGAQDFYIHEPALLRDGRVCMPVRWFNRVEGGKRVWYAKCWGMEPVVRETESGWRVIQQPFEIATDNLLKTFSEWCRDAELYAFPHPTHVWGKSIYPILKRIEKWTLNDPALGNPWRARSNGHRVLAVPLWMYCDDTSGNLSKKWNKHNSILFTLAGLPREHTQKEYNIHFLTTSNLAPPLEMMDGVIEQLENAQQTGIWAWDAQQQEAVLVVPFVLALLGDNPMQSEFACHMGMHAKFFCRNCWVKGHDASEAEKNHGARSSHQGDDTLSQVSDESEDLNPALEGESGESETESVGGRSRRRKAVESMAEMMTRVKAFVTRAKPRSKDETASKLRSYFETASVPGGKTSVAKERTASGIKDTFQLVFLEKLFVAVKNKRGFDAKQAAITAAIAELPRHTTNPIWRIKGMGCAILLLRFSMSFS